MRKFLRIVRNVLLGSLVAVIVLVAGVLIALQWKSVRGLVRDQVLAALRGSLKGELFVEDVRWPRLERLELSGVRLRDRHDVRVAEISSLQIDLNLSALFSGRVHVKKLDAEHVYVDLADLGSSSGLLSVFESDEPAEPADPDADMSPIAIAIDALCIAEGEVRLQPDVQRQLALRRLHTCLKLGIARALTVEVPELRGELQNAGASVLQLLPRGSISPLTAAGAPLAAADPEPAPDDGRPMRTALRGKLRFRTSTDMAFEADLPLRGFTPHTLVALGVESDFLRGLLDADVHAHAKGGRIDYRVDLRGQDSDATISGQWTPEKVLWAHVATTQLELAKLTSAEVDPITAELDARLDAANPDALELQLNLVRAQYGKFSLPETLVTVTRLADGGIELRSFDAHYRDAQLSGHGRLGSDGELALEASFDAADLATLQPLQALQLKAAGTTRARVSLTRKHNVLAGSVQVDMRSAKFEQNSAEHVQLNGEVSGEMGAPVVKAHLNAEGVQAGKERIASAVFELEGGPDRYLLRGRADTHKLVLDGWLESKLHCWDGGLTLDAELAGQPLHVAVALARFVPDQRLEIHELRAEYQDANVFADGELGLSDQPSKLRLAATVPDLARLTQQFANSAVPGHVEAIVSLKGKLAQPDAELRVSLVDGPALGGKPSRGELRVKTDAKQGKAQADLVAYAGEAHARANWRGTWKRSLPLTAAFAQIEHDLTVQLGGLSIAALASHAEDAKHSPGPPLEGVISGQLHAKGDRKKLELQTEWKSRLHPAADPTSFDALLSAKYEDKKLAIEARAGDRNGQMFLATFEHELELESLLEGMPSPDTLIDGMRWELKAELGPRQLRSLPFLSGVGIDRSFAPVMLATQLHVSHEPGAEPAGKFQTKLTWQPDPPENPDVRGETACSERTKGEVVLSADIGGGAVEIELQGGTENLDALKVQSGLRAPLADLLAGKNSQALVPRRVTVQVHDLDLQRVPLLCEHGRGVVSAKLNASDLWQKLAKVQLEMNGKALQWDDTPPFDAAVRGHDEGDDLALSAQLDAGKGTMRLDGRLPIGFHVGDPALWVNRKGPVVVHSRFERLALASLLAFVPGVARVSGGIDGTVAVTGTLEAPTANGKVKLDDVSLTLPRLGQRFSHAYLNAVLDGRTLRLEKGKFRDLDGSATLAAQLTFDSPEKWTAVLNANARNFPLRKSGVMLGRFDADAKVTAHTTRELTQVDVKLSSVAVQLTTDNMSAVQSLDPHEEIVFSDALPEPDPPQRETPDGEAGPASGRARISIASTEPLWIRRDDFAVQMDTELQIVLGGETPDLSGKVKLLRGYISLLGQSFDIKNGQVTFAGGAQVDPRLEINALHSGHTGRTVRLEVRGFVQKPELAFYVDDQAVTAGEAVIAMTGRGDDTGASASPEDQIASAAIGMTTGLLSLGARREFGDFIPMLAIDQTHVRVGLEADRLIPNFMRGFVRGAYVEGIISSEDPNSGKGGTARSSSATPTSTGSGGGVLLELMLPSDMVWAGQYGPGLCWSVDLAWRP